MCSARKTDSICRKEATHSSSRACGGVSLAGGSSPSPHAARISEIYFLRMENLTLKKKQDIHMTSNLRRSSANSHCTGQ